MYPVVGDTTWWVQIVKIKFISMVSKLKKQHMLSRQRPTASCSGWRNKCSLKFYEKLCTISGWDTFSIFYKLQLLLLKKFNVFFIFICSTLSPSSTAHFQSYSIETIHATYYRISIHTLPLAIHLFFSLSISSGCTLTSSWLKKLCEHVETESKERQPNSTYHDT